MNISWKKYIDKTSSNSPRPLLVKTVALTEARGVALDLGAGALVDSRYLLEQGFEHVIAIDADDAASERAMEIAHPGFQFIQSRFEDYDFPLEQFDIINGQFAFSFIDPASFDLVMGAIKRALKVGGLISGQIFGDRDEWNVPGATSSYLTKEKFDEVFVGFEILYFEEEELDKETALGKLKHWHTFHFIARRVV